MLSYPRLRCHVCRIVDCNDIQERPMPTDSPKVAKSDEEWRKELTPDQFCVLREHGTERAGTSPLNKEYRKGIFYCAACHQALFNSDTKFDSGTGWPSFF